VVHIPTKEVVMNVVIGVDPHKASHTSVAIDQAEDEVSSVKVRATRGQVEQLVRWAEPFEKRKWAIESAGGMGYLLAQQLVARGEDVLDVPATLASMSSPPIDRTRTIPTMPTRSPLRRCGHPGFARSKRPITLKFSDSWPSATGISEASVNESSVASIPSCLSSRREELSRDSTFPMQMP
jgi:transposase